MDEFLEELIEDHLGLAQAVAIKIWKTAPYALELDELKALANLGLVDAAQRWEKYCKDRGFDPKAVHFFKVYASRRIDGTIRDSIRKSDWAKRTLRGKAKKLKDAGQDSGASIEELSERTGLKEKDVRTTLARMAARPISLESVARPHNFYNDKGSYVDPYDRPEFKDHVTTEGSVFQSEMLDVLDGAIRQLSPDQQIVLALHYYMRLELRSVAVKLGITESRASQLHTKAVISVRNALLEAATIGE